jgi:hypothetical protein
MRFSERACGAALWSTARDLANFVIKIQLAIKGKSAKVLNTETAQMMLTPFLPQFNSEYGFFMDKKGNDYYFQHSGLNPGYASQYYGSCDGGNGVVVLVNSDMTDFVAEVVNAVATVYNWKDFYPYTTKKVISVSADTLKQYVGKYRFENSDNGPQITFSEGRL